MTGFFIVILLLLAGVMTITLRHHAPSGYTTPGRILRICTYLTLILSVITLSALLVGSGSENILSLIMEFLQNGQWQGLTETDRTILLSIRLPRILMAGIAGAALSISGVVLQALLRNPLADPYLLGVSGGSAVGAILAMLTGLGAMVTGVQGAAFIGAVMTMILVLGIAGKGRGNQAHSLLLAGVIVNAFFSAVIMFLISTSSSKELHGVLFWLMGDLSLITGDEIPRSALFLILGFAVCWTGARPLNVLIVGEESAMRLGIRPGRTRVALFLTASLIAAAVVSVCGMIGFVGLMIPHIMRILFGPDHRLLLPAAFLGGAAFMIMADTLARTAIAPAELPVGVITALCGAPYFIYLLARRSV